MIVKIVCASEDSFSKLYNRDEDELIIGCDGGCEILNELQIDYSVAIGDFDSYPIEKVSKNAKIIKFKKEKDESDLALAISYAKEFNPDEIQVYNATGIRLDHFYATLLLLKKFGNDNIHIIDLNNRIFISNDNKFEKDNFKYISFYAIEEDTIISLNGFKYNLNEYKLDIFDPLCLSNEIVSCGELKTNKPLLVFKSN